MKTIRFHPEAKVQLREAVRDYADEDRALGRRFEAKVTRALATIRAYPEAGIRDDVFRLKSVKPFRHWIVFVHRAQRTWIIAVHHERQDDSYWRKRLADIDEG